MYGYTVAQGLVHVLKACGDDLTRENIMKQAASIKDLELGGLLPGVKVNTVATDFAPHLPAPIDEVQGRNVGAVRRDHQRRRRRLKTTVNVGMSTKEAAPAALPQGLFLMARAKWYSIRSVKRAFESRRP